MAKRVKKVNVEPTTASLLPLAVVFLPLIIATFYSPQSNFVPNVVSKLLALSVAPFLVVVALYASKSWSNVGFPKSLSISILAFVGYLIFCTVISGEFWQGLVGTSDRNLGVITYLVFFLFTWVGFQLVKITNPKTLVYLITLLGVGEASIANYQYFVGEKSAAITGTFFNSNPVSYLLGVTAASILAFLVYEKKRHTTEFFTLVLCLLWIFTGLYVCGSQQGLIVFALIIIVLVVTKFIGVMQVNFAKLLFPTFLFATLTHVLVSLALPIKDNSQIASNSFLERLEIYKSALKLALYYPVFGVGIDSFHEKYGQATINSLLPLVDNAHSVPLQILSTLGFIGFVLWLTIIFFVFRNAKSDVTYEKSEFKFFQIGFFSYLLIGIIGIEHPVIGAISWLMAGALIRLSSRPGVDSRAVKSNLSTIKFENSTVLAGSMGIIAFSLYLLPQQLVLGKVLTDFSEGNLTSSEYKSVIVENINSIWNPSQLLTSGRAYIAINQQVNAYNIAKVMLSKYPNDQRTSVLLFDIANKWNDVKAQRLAEQVRDRIFK